jgi:hypothetical protein
LGINVDNNAQVSDHANDEPADNYTPMYQSSEDEMVMVGFQSDLQEIIRKIV